MFLSHIDVSPPLFLLPSSLSKNKKIKSKKLLDSETRSIQDINVYICFLLEEVACLSQVEKDANVSLSTSHCASKPLTS